MISAAHHRPRPVGGGSSRGFALISLLLLIGLAAVLLAVLHLELELAWRSTLRIQAGLQSQVLAENGLEYARSLLNRVEIQSLLSGADGAFCAGDPEWRNPVPFSLASTVGIEEIALGCDDGLPHLEGQPLDVLRRSPQGVFAVRFSNNPEEDAGLDTDGVVLVRSLGVAELPISDPAFPKIRNAVTLLEARLRRERAFALGHPMTFFAERGSFEWQGEEILVESGEAPFAWASLDGSRLGQDLEGSLEGLSPARFQTDSESLIDEVSADWASDIEKRAFFSALFWDRFEAALPLFDRGFEGGLAYMESPGALDVSFEGLLAVRGDLTLTGQTRFRGVLLHLGGGRLTLEGEAQVVGAIWASALGRNGDSLTPGTVVVGMRGRSSVQFNRRAVEEAIAQLPPTQLGWRIILPEMAR